ncbi:hypothetical protein C8Q75DRAFT_804617 [Abortiporus biennis]|nr:hypothetical protein C8Q75DRAFT_804617 [Abortiporus biennis]
MAELNSCTPTGSASNPTTPPTPQRITHLPNPSTPVSHKISGLSHLDYRILKNHPTHRDDIRKMTGREVQGSIRQIPAEQFIEDFLQLPSPQEKEAIQKIVDSIEFPERLKTAGGRESERYSHIIELIQPAWKDTDLLARNVSLYGQNSKFKITTDIVAYHRHGLDGTRTEHDLPPNPPKKRGAPSTNAAGHTEVHQEESVPEVVRKYAAKMNHFDAQLFLEDKTEFKYAALHTDPNEPFLVDGKEHEATRGQVGEYAVAILRRQHRTHLFSVLTVANIVHFLRWDRCGVVVSKPVCFEEDLTTFITFFYRFGRMTPQERGVDTSISQPDDKDKAILAAFRNNKLPSLPPNHQAMFKQAFDLENTEDDGWPIVKIELDRLSSTESDDDSIQPPSTEEHSEKKINLLIRYPRVSSRSPFGRATKGFVALDLGEQKLKFLKDCWRYEGGDYHPEIEVYKKLRKGNARNIATVEGGGDVFDSVGDKERQVTLAQKYLSTEKSKYLALVHYRLLIRQLGTPLEEYDNSYMLCYYLSLILLGHESAWLAGVLHRDISPSNIMIDEEATDEDKEAFLLDWDLSRYTTELDKSPSQKTRSGTWAFISSLLLKYPAKHHELSDDLESLVHVLDWFCLRYHPHDLSKKPQLLARKLNNIYLDFYQDKGYDQGGADKFQLLRDGKRCFTLSEEKVAPGLIKLVEGLGELCKKHYATVDLNALEAASANLTGEEDPTTKTEKPVAINKSKTVKRNPFKRTVPATPTEEKSENRKVSNSQEGNNKSTPSGDGKSEGKPNEGSGKADISPFATHKEMKNLFEKLMDDTDLWTVPSETTLISDKVDDQLTFVEIPKSVTIGPILLETQSKRTSTTAGMINGTPVKKKPRVESESNDVASGSNLADSTSSRTTGRSSGHNTKSRSKTGGGSRRTKSKSGTSSARKGA